MKPIIVERNINTNLASAWRAITVQEEMIQWYFDNIPDFKAEVGFETGFKVQAPSRDFYHLWKITKVVPSKMISYTWNYTDIQGESVSTFEISEEKEGIKLMLTCEGLENLPQDIPEFSRESCTGGWNYFLDRLKNYLEE